MYRKLITAKKDQEGEDWTGSGTDLILYRYSLLYGDSRSYVCDIPNWSHQTWQSFPVPRSMTVSLLALFTASLSLFLNPHLW